MPKTKTDGRRYSEERYQGREVTDHLKAPTKESLDDMISDWKEWAVSQGMEDIKTLSKRKDPDGGWEAIMVAHNWNPITWVKGKLAERKERKIAEAPEREKRKKEIEEAEHEAERERLRSGAKYREKEERRKEEGRIRLAKAKKKGYSGKTVVAAAGAGYVAGRRGPKRIESVARPVAKRGGYEEEEEEYEPGYWRKKTPLENPVGSLAHFRELTTPKFKR